MSKRIYTWLSLPLLLKIAFIQYMHVFGIFIEPLQYNYYVDFLEENAPEYIKISSFMLMLHNSMSKHLSKLLWYWQTGI